MVVPSNPREDLYEDEPEPEDEPALVEALVLPLLVPELLDDLLLLLQAAATTATARSPTTKPLVEFRNFTFSPFGVRSGAHGPAGLRVT